jgi:SSS family solute:Na+ symporter
VQLVPHLSPVDYIIIGIYFAFVLGIGFFVKSKIQNSNDFLTGNRTVPLWITSLAFISANLGAQEVMGMAASGAKYGIMTAHFYWLGAVPAMIFLSLFMMPFYYGSRARSVPEYLRLRFDEKTRAFNAVSFLVMTLFSSGISLYALAILFETLLGWSFQTSVLLSSGIVMAYIFLGGLTSAIYNEVFQFFLIVLGISPIVFIGIAHLGGWAGFMSHLPPVMKHTWKYLGSAESNPMGVNWASLTMGLGFVLSFGYWCTDFLIIQRAMVARNMASAQKTPLLAAIPKMFFPFIVVLPGLIAVALVNMDGSFQLPLRPDQKIDYNMTLPTLLYHFFPSGLLGLGLTALLASFMSGMAGNVTAFNSVWTYDIYEAYFYKNAPDAHYLKVGRITTVVGILLSIGAAFLTRSFDNLNDLLQLICGFVNAPLFATFFLGMFWKRTTGHGAFWGLVTGTLGAALVHGASTAEGKGGWLLPHPWYEFHSGMGQALGTAIVAWSVCFIVTVLVSLVTRAKPDTELKGLVYSVTERLVEKEKRWYFRPVPIAIAIAGVALWLNLLWF